MFLRRLGTTDAVVIGLAAMVGAGVFVVFGPATSAAGELLLVSLVLAAGIAYCNARSTARLAAVHPVAGGSYFYGRAECGPFWGFLAGWGFVIGKIASCAAIAVTVGSYLWPDQARWVAVGAVLAVTAVNAAGVQKSARVSRYLVAVVLVVLVTVAAVGLTGSHPIAHGAVPDPGVLGVLQGAGLLFFAFAGYARIATLGEEVRHPERTIPRSIMIALGITVVLYLTLAVMLLDVLGSSALAGSTRPLADAMRAVGVDTLVPVVSIAAAVAALGSLMALILGVSRTTVAMARNRDLPHRLARVEPGSGVPRTAELTIGLVIAVLAAFWDLRGAIGFSSFGVLVYYAVANASAWRLQGAGRGTRAVAAVGLTGCVVLAATLPAGSVIAGAGVLIAGSLGYWLRTRRTAAV
ncbi:amino acid permease [Nakamurella silvestris]|nr:amino acid permease [Nakamurella silvestris]